MRLCIVIAIVITPLAIHSADASNDRVKRAQQNAIPILKAKFAAQGIDYPAKRLFLRAFKQEGQLEMWASNGDDSYPYKKIETYQICKSSGTLGPKRQQGDLQVPEGIYTINLFNPRSSYHLSMRVSYPNASDRIRGTTHNLGGAIMIHGECVTIGCLPIQNGPVEQVFVAAKASSRYQRIPIHIFPARMTPANMMLLERSAPRLVGFWRELEPIYRTFENTHRLPHVRIDRNTGAYILKPLGERGN